MSRRIVLVDIGSALILRGALPSMSLNAAYSAKLTASGGIPPYSYTIVDGALPDGITLDVTTGMLSGVASEGGQFPVTVEARDVTGATVRKVFVLVVQANPLLLVGALPTPTQYATYTATLTVSGGVPPYSNARVAGMLPAGMSVALAGDSVTVSGSVDDAGDFSGVIKVDDSAGNTAALAYDWSIVAVPLLINLPMLDDFVDRTGRVWTPHGSVAIVDGAGYFNGTAYLSTPFTADLVANGLELTLEARITGNKAFFFTSSYSAIPFACGLDDGGGNPGDNDGRYPYVTYIGGSWNTTRYGTPMPTDEWITWRFVRSSMQGPVQESIYMNDVLVAQSTHTPSVTTARYGSVMIGRRWDGYNGPDSQGLSLRNLRLKPVA